MNKTYAKLLIFMAMAAALIGCPPTEEAVKISFSANGGVGTMADQDATVTSLTVGTQLHPEAATPIPIKEKLPLLLQ